MDLNTRDARPTPPASHHDANGTPSNRKSKLKGSFTWNKAGYLGFLTAVGILVIGVILLVSMSGGYREAKAVDNSKYQAVFLNGGQVYFGKISELNRSYMKVGNIYYLRVNQQVQPNQQQDQAQNDISLVKLGCELHGPQDSMVINRDQIIFWENLKDDGQVAKAIDQYVKANPQGQKCQTNSGTNTTNSTSNTSNTTNTNNTTNSTNKTTNTTGR